MAWNGMECSVPLVRLLDEEQNMVCVSTYAPFLYFAIVEFFSFSGVESGIKIWKLIAI